MTSRILGFPTAMFENNDFLDHTLVGYFVDIDAEIFRGTIAEVEWDGTAVEFRTVDSTQHIRLNDTNHISKTTKKGGVYTVEVNDSIHLFLAPKGIDIPKGLPHSRFERIIENAQYN